MIEIKLWKTPFLDLKMQNKLFTPLLVKFLEELTYTTLEAEEQIPVTTRPIKNFIWPVWNIKTFRFNSALPIGNGNEVI